MSEYTHPMPEYSTVPIARPMRADATVDQWSGLSPDGGAAWD